MVAIFIGLAHIVLLLSAFGLLALAIYIVLGSFKVVYRDQLTGRYQWFESYVESHEILMRSLAAACGLLIYLGTKAVGLSIPALMVQSMSASFPLSIGLIGVVLPSAMGFFVSWYVVRFLNSTDALKDVVGMRVLSLTIMFVFFLYCDSYVASFGAASDSNFTMLLPNLTFVLSVLLYAIFKYHPLGKEYVYQQAANRRQAS